MANQGLDRRTVLEMLAKAAVASQFPGFNLWAFGAEKPPARQHGQPYEPMYFSQPEYQTIEVLTDLIIPADETAGAKEAGVSEFIDFMAAHGEAEIQQPMRDGLAWLDTAAKNSYGNGFAHLSSEQQSALLKSVAYRNQFSSEDVKGQTFFQLIRRYTVMGYYTSRIGLEELDFPGLRLYTQSPACPHTNDPEHLHLSSSVIGGKTEPGSRRTTGGSLPNIEGRDRPVAG
jgi:gluconate 2-dehydrogenase gamma chain